MQDFKISFQILRFPVFKLSLVQFGFPHSSVGKESTCNAGDLGLIPGMGRSFGEGKGYPLQCSGLENSTDCIVHGVAKSRTPLSDFHFIHFTVVQASKNIVTHQKDVSFRIFALCGLLEKAAGFLCVHIPRRMQGLYIHWLMQSLQHEVGSEPCYYLHYGDDKTNTQRG